MYVSNENVLMQLNGSNSEKVFLESMQIGKTPSLGISEVDSSLDLHLSVTLVMQLI